MPAPDFGGVRGLPNPTWVMPGTHPGVGGLSDPSQGQDLPAYVRQAAFTAGQPARLHTPPKLGNVLLLGVGSDQIGINSASGGNATWTRIGRTTSAFNGGAQIECDLWVGVVTSVGSSTTITRTFLNNGGMYVAELEMGLAGTVVAATSTNSTGAMTTSFINGRGDARYGRRVLTVGWYVGRVAGPDLMLNPVLNVLDSGYWSNGPLMRMCIRVAALADQARIGFVAGGANGHDVVLGMVA